MFFFKYCSLKPTFLQGSYWSRGSKLANLAAEANNFFFWKAEELDSLIQEALSPEFNAPHIGTDIWLDKTVKRHTLVWQNLNNFTQEQRQLFTFRVRNRADFGDRPSPDPAHYYHTALDTLFFIGRKAHGLEGIEKTLNYHQIQLLNEATEKLEEQFANTDTLSAIFEFLETYKKYLHPRIFYVICRKVAQALLLHELKDRCEKDFISQKPKTPLHALTRAIFFTTSFEDKSFDFEEKFQEAPEYQKLDFWTCIRDIFFHREELSDELKEARIAAANFLKFHQKPSSQPSEQHPDTTADIKMTTHTQVNLPLPVLPQGWTSEKDFKAIGKLSAATQRSIEPVGPHFLAHARRARHKRTFSEDDRIQAQENVKKVEDDDSGEISEPEDPMMLSRDAKDWKVS